MLIMEVETDPLSLKDPLDCQVNVMQDNLEDSSKWNIPFQTKEVSETKVNLRKREKKSFIAVENEDFNRVFIKKSNSRRISKKRALKPAKSKTKSFALKPSKKEKEIIFKNQIKGKNYLKKSKLSREKRNYLCESCNTTFITASHLKEHVLNHCQSFQCKECIKVFTHLKSLQSHIADEHEPQTSVHQIETEKKNGDNLVLSKKKMNNVDKPFKKYYAQLKSVRKYNCEVCQKTFITIGHLNAHMCSHSGKKWKCEGCEKNFSCERSLTRHKNTFPGEHWFPCQFCEMSFFRPVNIVKHMEIKHLEASLDIMKAGELILSTITKDEKENSVGKKIFICTKCFKVFNTSESLKNHKETAGLCDSAFMEKREKVNVLVSDEHIPNYKCNLCPKEFVSSEGFEYHKNNVHTEKKQTKRKKSEEDLCSNSENIENDIVLEQKVEAFICKICLESFSLKSSLQVHLKSHNVSKNIEIKSGSHQCCICPRSFVSSDGLKYHLATHTGERRYSCAQCGKKFIKKTHLFEHIATHSKVKCFKCLRCPRTFSTHSAYRKHIKHFPGPHSFPCTKCGKLFTKESMIERHTCVDLIKVTMAPEVKALLSGDNTESGDAQMEKEEGETLSSLAVNESVNKANPQQISDVKENSHSCYKCFKVFPNLTLLQSHQNEHIGKQHYQCRFCPENFKRADDFGTHIRNHLGSSPYMCLKCNRKFISPLTLSIHAKKYPGDHSFTCPKCQRWFPSEKRLEKHECILQNAETFICACKSSFKAWSEFVHHAGSKPYQCCSCSLKYSTLVALARHIKKHTGAKPFTCEVCSKAFRAKNNYLHHMNIHKDAKEISCEHCEFKSKSQKRMNFHLFRKHDIGSNMNSSTLCPICGIMLPYVTHMKKHVEVEHDGEFFLNDMKNEKKSLSAVLCTFCGKLLSNKYMLANHMKKVHDPDTQKNDTEVKCEVCDEKFKSKKLLQRHVESHEVPTLRLCEICNKEFYFSKDLRKHMKKHDSNKPYSCPKCGKNFKVSVSLKYHSSICGNGNAHHRGNRQKKDECLESDSLIYFNHTEPFELKNQMCTLVYRRRWNE